ncbi:hypothetical protein FOVSG1_000042 [Fusarium oxysporum f. sp. vasinfectum]
MPASMTGSDSYKFNETVSVAVPPTSFHYRLPFSDLFFNPRPSRTFAESSTTASVSLIAQVLSDYEYDEEVGFTRVNDVPFIGCVSAIYCDVSCACAGCSERTGRIYCEHHILRCAPFPPVLRGVAQYYWNTVQDLADRDLDNQLESCQLWRIIKAIRAGGSAWRGMVVFFSDDLTDLARAGEDLPRDQLHGHENVSRPAYVVAAALQDALDRLDSADDTPLRQKTSNAYFMPSPRLFTRK